MSTSPTSSPKVAQTFVPLLLEEERSAGLHTLARVDDGRQLLVVDLEQRERVLGDVAAVRNDDGDGVSDEAHLLLRERALEERDELRQRVHAHRDRADVTHVRGQEHRLHAWQRASGLRADREDARVGMRAAHDRRVQRARRLDIGHVSAAAAQEPRILLAPHRRADEVAAAHSPNSLAAFS